MIFQEDTRSKTWEVFDSDPEKEEPIGIISWWEHGSEPCFFPAVDLALCVSHLKEILDFMTANAGKWGKSCARKPK